MKTDLSVRELHSRPKDRSLEGYKAWIMELAERLTTKKNAINFTETEWKEHWKEFWKQKSRS